MRNTGAASLRSQPSPPPDMEKEVLRSHVMVRVGGGWDTLSHYLDKHDPCRCRAQHRPTLGARVIQRYPPANNGQCIDLASAEVHYDRSPPRTRRSSVSSVGSSGGGSPQNITHLGPPQHTAARQRSRSPAGQADRGYTSLPYMGSNAFENQAFNHLTADQAYKQNKYINRRSVSPSPARKFSNRTQSPNPQRKTSMQTYSQISSTVYNNPALVPSSTLLPSPHRNGRSRSPTPKVQNYLSTNGHKLNEDNTPLPISNVFENQVFEHVNELNTIIDGTSNGSENASDNGSEVSDEGYRSLGIIQNGSAQTTPPSVSSGSKDEIDRGLNLKLNRLSLNSQASTDDADYSERTDFTASETTLKGHQSSSDWSSQMSTTEDRIRGSDDSPGSACNEKMFSERQKSPMREVSSATGLRKTNYSETLYGDKKPGNNMILEKKHVRHVSSPVVCLEGNDSPSQSLKNNASISKIPQSPVLQRRRLSMENLSPTTRSRSVSRDRFAARDRSSSREPYAKLSFASKNSDSKPPVPVNSPTHSSGSYGKITGGKMASIANNTWNGRNASAKGKSRPPVTNDTFTSPGSKNVASKTSSPSFQRNSTIRSSTSALRTAPSYDHNGRRIKSPQNSPSKLPNPKPYSPLLETILKTAENAQDDAMMLEKMKDIIKQYSGLLGSEQTAQPVTNDLDDFTSAWVHSNGTLERSQSSRQLRDSLNNCSDSIGEADAYESGECSSGFKSTALVSKIPMFSSTPRRDSKAVGLTSRIPAPVSYKKASDFYD